MVISELRSALRLGVRMFLGGVLIGSFVMGVSGEEGPGEDQAGQASVTVTVKSVRNAKGRVGVALFDSATGFPEDHAKARQRCWVSISNGVAVARFDGVRFGSYAIAAFHDENANGKGPAAHKPPLNVTALPKCRDAGYE